jgi:hypothetical protein
MLEQAGDIGEGAGGDLAQIERRHVADEQPLQ